FEEEKLEQKHRDRRKRCSRDRRSRSDQILLRPKTPGREKNREEASFQKKDVPLKAKKRLAGDAERKIKNEKNGQRNSWSNSKNQQERDQNAATAKKMEEAVARIEPAESWQNPNCFVSNIAACRRQIIADWQDAIRSNET